MSRSAVRPVQNGVRLIRYNALTVNINVFPTTQNSMELDEVCDRLQKMGYAEFKRIRIYGQEFEVVSNPFPQGDGIAIRAFSKRETQTRTLRLPLPVVQMVTRQKQQKKKIA
jgi:hypothetical protein